MPLVVEDTPEPSPRLLALLGAHMPYALPVLRRLQFTSFPGGAAADGHVLFCSYGDDGGDRLLGEKEEKRDGGEGQGEKGRHFAAAYVDLSKGPETEAWVYSTYEDTTAAAAAAGKGEENVAAAEIETERDEAAAAACVEQVLALLQRMRAIAAERLARSGRPVFHGSGVMVGSLHEGVRRLLMMRAGVTASYWNPHDKWLFRVEDLPPPPAGGSDGLPPGLEGEGMKWDVVRREDVPLVISRTHIPKSESTLMLLPSAAIRPAAGGAPVAWAFLGIDGTLSTLHVEEPFRGRGVARALAARVIRAFNGAFGGDGWCAADVHVDNVRSQAVCRSIGGKRAWAVSWTVIDFASLGEAT